MEPCLVQDYLREGGPGENERFDVVYLDFCSSFDGAFDTVRRVARVHLRPGGALAYTVCNRGKTLEEVCFDLLRHRELAREASLRLDTCVAYGSMVTVILVRDRGQGHGRRVAPAPDPVDDAPTPPGMFRVDRLVDWRVVKGVLEFKVAWRGQEEASEDTWEPAQELARDVDRASLVRFVHEMDSAHP